MAAPTQVTKIEQRDAISQCQNLRQYLFVSVCSKQFASKLKPTT